MNSTPLTSLSPGESGIVNTIDNSSPIKTRLRDIGFTNGATVRCEFASPFGDPIAYKIKNTTVALRKTDASDISVIKKQGD